MLNIKMIEEYMEGDNIVEEKWFDLYGAEGYYLYEENWYEPLEYRFMRISWNGTSIVWDNGYRIRGPLPSDNALKELSRIFDSTLYESIKAGDYNIL